VGQEHVTKTLSNAILAERVSHAYLFAGPRGVGKTTTARILAKALNCRNRSSSDPCNKCESCLEITAGRNMDVMEIDGASNRGIDEIRDLREKIRYAATSGMYKVYIIDEVHMLSTEAFNALLKTLEEPPAHVVFVFATTQAFKVPATILSRCQRFDFRRISVSEISDYLSSVAEKEALKVSREVLSLLATRADGSLRDGLSLLDQVASSGEGLTDPEAVRQLLGIGAQQAYAELLDAIAAKDERRALGILNESLSLGCDLEEFLNGLLEHLRGLLFAKEKMSAEEAGFTGEAFDRLKKHAGELATADIVRMMRMASETSLMLRRGAMPRLHLEILLIELCNLESAEDISRLIERLEGIERTGGGSTPAGGTRESVRPGRSSGRNPAAPAAERKAEPGTPGNGGVGASEPALGEGWKILREKIQERKKTLGVFIDDADALATEKGSLVLGFPVEKGFHKEMAEKGNNRKILESEMKKIWPGLSNVKFVTIEPGRSESPPGNEKLEPPGAASVEEKIKLVIDRFDGELI